MAGNGVLRNPHQVPTPPRSSAGVGGLAGLGQLPWGPAAPPRQQVWAPPGCANPMQSPQGFRSTPLDPTEALLEGAAAGQKRLMDLTVDDLEQFVRSAIFWNQPSPLQAPPYRGFYKELKELFVLAPPTASAAAAATAGAQALADGVNETQDPNDQVTVLTPATGGEFVTVLTFRPDSNMAYMVYSMEAWGHDWLGSLNAVKWRLIVGGQIVLDNVELGVLGDQVRVQKLVKPGVELKIQATTWDGESGTLCNVRVQGWQFPLPDTSDDMWALVRQGMLSRSNVTVVGQGSGVVRAGGPGPAAPVAPPPSAPSRVQLVQQNRHGATVWVDPRDNSAIWFSGSHPAFAAFPQFDGYRMTWVGTQWAVDQLAKPVPGFDAATMTVAG